MTLANRIRRARKISGMSQAELALRMKVHRSCVGHWEGVSGANPGPDRLAELAVVFAISYEWLATGRGPMKLGHDPSEDIPAAFGRLVDDPETLRMLRAWEAMPMRSRTALLEITEQLALARKPKGAREADVIKLESGFFDRGSGSPVTY